MSRIFVLFLLVISTCQAQFEQLVTLRDGSRVRFVSDLSLQHDPEKFWSKIFEADGRGVRLLLVDDPEQGVQPLPYNAKFYQRIAPDMSADGLTQAYTGFRTCVGGSACLNVQRYLGHFATPGSSEERSILGLVRLSSNGRWAVAYGANSFGIEPQTFIVNLETDRATRINLPAGPLAGPGRRLIANTGRVVFNGFDGSLVIAEPDGAFRQLPARPAGASIIDDQGRFVIYQTLERTVRLRRIDLSTHEDRELVAADSPCFGQSLAEDGRKLLFLSAANWEGRNNDALVQAWTMDLETGGLRQISSDPAGLAEATISGDGAIIWAVTLGGRLAKIDVATGLTNEIVPRTAVGQNNYRSVAGSQSTLEGRGLVDRAHVPAPPFPHTVAGVRIGANGRLFPLIAVTPTEIRLIAPWDVRASSVEIRLDESGSPFRPRLNYTLGVVERGARFFEDQIAGRNLVRAAHGDWSSLVTQENPARPGEVIHMYATGLGPVIGLPAVDQPAPFEPPALLADRMQCALLEPATLSRRATELLFAGLAPGMAGIYQVTLRLPDPAPEWGSQPQTVSCSFDGGTSDTFYSSFFLRN